MSDSERRLGGDKILLDVSAATKDRLLAGSWSADSGDELVKPSRGSSLASMEMRTCVGLAFSFSALRED